VRKRAIVAEMKPNFKCNHIVPGTTHYPETIKRYLGDHAPGFVTGAGQSRYTTVQGHGAPCPYIGVILLSQMPGQPDSANL
jgi:hypothetical protein